MFLCYGMKKRMSSEFLEIKGIQLLELNMNEMDEIDQI